jgi:DNA-binding NarL/FixJ family response regulator
VSSDAVGFMRAFGPVRKWSDATITVLVCDDGALVRRHLIVALEASPDIEVVAEVADVDTALAEVAVVLPDVVWSGFAEPAATRLIAQIVDRAPSARIAVLTGSDERETIPRALRAGALAFVRREEAPAVAVEVTDRLAWGGHALGADGFVALRDAYGDLPLDDRSRSVLGALADGAIETDVAARHGLPAATVDHLVANAIARLARHARTEALRRGGPGSLLDGPP